MLRLDVDAQLIALPLQSGVTLIAVQCESTVQRV